MNTDLMELIDILDGPMGWKADIQRYIAEAIGEDVDIEQWPKGSEERWGAIVANSVRSGIRDRLGVIELPKTKSITEASASEEE